MEVSRRRTWAEIDLGRLRHNYLALRGLLPDSCKFMGVVKANAYGHGALPVARTLEACGADYLAVACLDEAEELRAGGIAAPILILGPTPPECATTLLDLNLTQAVGDRETAQALSQAAVRWGKSLNIHIKVDTGMSRLGILADEEHSGCATEEIAALCALPGLVAEGIFTHCSDADGSEEYTLRQLTRFLDLLATLEGQGVTFPLRHCAASAATLRYPCTHLDMVRPGIALYGHYPAPDMEPLCPLLPVLSLHTQVAAVRELPKGACVSYGRTHVLERDSRLAVLPVGYGDGLPRLLSNRGAALISGQRAPILGRVCMDLTMVDLTDLPDAALVRPGDPVTLYGDALPVEEAADLVGTIQYELLCAVSPRVPRVYLD